MNDTVNYAEQNPEDTIKDVLTVMETLPVPGFGKVIGPINAILGTLEEDPIETVITNLKDANEKLDNMYNVVKSALDLNDVEAAHQNMTNDFEEIGNNIIQDTKDAGAYLGTVIEMKKQFNNVLANSENYLLNNKEASKTKSATLSKFIGDCMVVVEYSYEAFAIITDTYRQLEKFHENTEAPTGDWDYLKARCQLQVNQAGAQYQKFTDKLDHLYPDCIKPLMLGRFKLELTEVTSRRQYVSIADWTKYNAKVLRISNNDVAYACPFELIAKSSADNDQEGRWNLRCWEGDTEHQVGAAHLPCPSSSVNQHHTYPILGPLPEKVKEAASDNDYTDFELWDIEIQNEKFDFARAEGNYNYDDGSCLKPGELRDDGYLTIRENNYFGWRVFS